jgi:hypothetical protein
MEPYYTLSKPVLSKYVTDVFFETGTYLGDSVKLALECGFKKVISIEIYEPLHTDNLKKFETQIHEGSVELIFGDSLVEMQKILGDLNEKTTFWLDAHVDFGPGGLKVCPLYEELEAIALSPIKNHTILIDDLRCLGNNHWGENISIEGIKERILKINPDYQFSFENSPPFGPEDILAAYIK